MKKLIITIKKEKDNYFFITTKKPILYTTKKGLNKSLKDIIKQLKDLNKDLNENNKMTKEWKEIKNFLNALFNRKQK